MIMVILNILKRIAVLIIPLLIVSCAPAPQIIIHNLVSDSSIEKNKLSNLFSNSCFRLEKDLGRSLSLLDLKLDGREVEFQKISANDPYRNIYDQYILEPGIHRIQVSYSRILYSSGSGGLTNPSISFSENSIGLITNDMEFDAKPGESYGLSYETGYFSKLLKDSTILYFNIQMPVIRNGKGEREPLLNPLYNEFKPNVSTTSLQLYNGEPLFSSQTAKLLQADGRLGILNISGQNEKTAINYDRLIETPDEYKVLPGKYDIKIVYAVDNFVTKNDYTRLTYYKLLHLNALAGHTYKVNWKGEWDIIIDDITIESP